MDEDEVSRPRLHEVGMPLDALSIDELAHRIAILREEIVRIEAAIEAQGGVGLPATLHGEVIDCACADPVGLEARPGAGGGRGHILGGLSRPGGKDLATLIAKRAFQRHADAHPAVVIKLVIRQPVERRPDGGQGADLPVAAQQGGR